MPTTGMAAAAMPAVLIFHVEIGHDMDDNRGDAHHPDTPDSSKYKKIYDGVSSETDFSFLVLVLVRWG
jgi:hypothetical protein